MKIGYGYPSAKKHEMPWEEKRKNWENYQEHLTDLVQHTKTLPQEDRQALIKYRETIRKGVTITPKGEKAQ